MIGAGPTINLLVNVKKLPDGGSTLRQCLTDTGSELVGKCGFSSSLYGKSTEVEGSTLVYLFIIALI